MLKMTQKVTINRMTVISGEHEIMSPIYENVDINIQGLPTGSFSTLVINGKTYKMYKGYIEWVYDIREDDEIVDSNWNKYFVNGSSIYNTDYTDNVQLELLKFVK